MSALLGEIFYWLFNMSVAASVSGGIVLCVRCVKRIPRRFLAVLWAIPFIRMWCPVGIGSRYGLLTLLSRFTTKTVVVYELGDAVSFSYTNYAMAASSYFPVTYRVNLLEDIFRTAAGVWAVVAGGLLLAFALLYITTLRELKDSRHLRDNIYLSDRITSPAVYGIIRPKVILPVSYQEKDLTFILLHETAHIKRKDNLWRVLAFVTAALHWFNPLAWVFLNRFLTDLELSCDEWVLAKCPASQKKAYALALVACAEDRNVFASAFGGAKIRVRIENILSYRKLSLISAMGFSLLVVTIAYILLTNAR